MADSTRMTRIKRIHTDRVEANEIAVLKEKYET